MSFAAAARTRVLALAAVAAFAATSGVASAGMPVDAKLFAPTSVWNTPLPSQTPTDPLSQQLVAELVRQTQAVSPWINTTNYTTDTYTVPADQPNVHVTLDHPNPFLRAAFDQVPIPANAVASGGTDQHMTVYQPSTDKLWEFWLMHREADGWHARWGGHKTNVSTDDGIFRNGYGASGSGLPLIAGTILPDEIRRGRIDHPLVITMPNTLVGVFRSPATRTDGTGTGVPMGTRFRLPASVDVRALGLNWTAALMAKAAQEYGIIVRNTGGAVAFYAEDSRDLGYDVWPSIFEGRSASQVLRAFPWDKLVVVPPPLGL